MTHTNHDIRALVEQAEERFLKLYPDLQPVGPAGKRATIRSMAFQEVAATLQMEVKTVRQKWRRAGLEPRRIRKEERERFDYLGVEVSESYRRMLASIEGTLKTSAYAITAVRTNLTKMAGRYPHPAPVLSRLFTLLEDVSESIRRLKPIGICPWCKNVAGIRDKCTACHSSGWLTWGQRDIVPNLLKHKDMAFRDGQIQMADTSDQVATPETLPPPPPLSNNAEVREGDSGSEDDPMPWEL